MPKVPNPIDVHVGSRVRLRRMMIGMSQERLGEQLKLTFQQVQKYEKGANRIGSSRLYTIARILDVPVQYFFDDMPPEIDVALPEEMPSPDQTATIMDYVGSTEGLQLNQAFQEIKKPALRKKLVELVATIARNHGS